MKPHVLVVDDETALCEMIAMHFEHSGLEVTTAGKPQQANELIEKTRFDAIVLDLNLAGEDGLEVLRFVKARTPELPVIIFTGLDVDEHMVKKHLADRVDGFIRKTAGLGILLAEVKRHLPKNPAA